MYGFNQNSNSIAAPKTKEHKLCLLDEDNQLWLRGEEIQLQSHTSNP